MRLAIGHPRAALILAPHPDDETIGAAGLIRLLVRGGTRVSVVIVSDGAASHPGSKAWPRPRLVAGRRRESRRALLRLGVPAGRVRFLGLPDGGLGRRENGCTRAVRRSVAMLRRLDLVVGPTLRDAHPDHRAVAAAILACPPRIRRLGFRVWPPVPVRGGRTLPIAGGHAAKRSLIRLYRTQTGVIRDDPAGFAIARHELAAFSRPIEHFCGVGA